MKAALAMNRSILPTLVVSSTLLFSALTGIAPVYAADPPARADDRSPLVETVERGKGRINYSAGVVKATGYGALPDNVSSAAQARLMAMGAARADALRTLAMTVSSIQVTATTTVKNYQLQSDTVETRLSALLQSPRIVSQSVQPDGTAVVVVELPMYGANSVASAVLPEVLPKSAASDGTPAASDTTETTESGDNSGAYSPSANDMGPTPAWKGPDQPAIRVTPSRANTIPAELPGGVEPGLTPASDNGPFTSVVVDCRGLNIEAIMSPKLLDTTGREIYGTVRVTAEYAIETGIVGYPRTMGEALHTARCGAHPLIVKALRAGDKYRFNPVISAEDGDRILAANGHDHFLESTRVIFLVDPLK